MNRAALHTLGLAAATAALWTSVGLAQTPPAPPTPPTSITPAPAAQVVVDTGRMKQDLYARLWKPLTVDIKETSLASVLEVFTQATGVQLDVMWLDDKNATGLSKETQVSVKADRTPAITFLERVLEKVSSDPGNSSGTGGNGWQLTEDGVLQIGPKERLNTHKRTELYDIKDLLTETTDFTGAPNFDLSQTTQDGGGSSQSPFQGGNNANSNQTGRTLEERGQELIKIIVDTVEPEQWQDNGGNGASIKFWRGSLIINAPEYIHRQIDGDGKGSSNTLKFSGGATAPSITKAPKSATTPALADAPAPGAPTTKATSKPD